MGARSMAEVPVTAAQVIGRLRDNEPTEGTAVLVVGRCMLSLGGGRARARHAVADDRQRARGTFGADTARRGGSSGSDRILEAAQGNRQTGRKPRQGPA